MYDSSNHTPAATGLAWSAALAGATILGSLAASCMMPFVALSVLAAATMPPRRATATIAAIWAVNQAIGFTLLGYPSTAYAMAWGIAIGTASLAAGAVAALLLGQRATWSVARLAAAFGLAFLAYEGLLFGFALVAGGTETFATAIVLQILANEGVWFVGLAGLYLGLTRAAPLRFGSAPAVRIA